MNEELAVEREIRGKLRRAERGSAGLTWHVRVYVLVCALLVTINVLTTPSFLWSLIVGGAWGLAVALHWFFVRDRDEREQLIADEVEREMTRRRVGQGR